MSKIVVVDDDYSMELLVDALNFRGHNAVRIKSAEDALARIDEVAGADLIVLDIIMEAPPSFEGNSAISGGTTTGMALLNAFRARQPTLKVLVYTGCTAVDVVEAIKEKPSTEYLAKTTHYARREILERINAMIGASDAKQHPRAFIVHGHDDRAKMDLKNYLQNTLGFPEPMILHEQPNLGRTIIEKFEAYAQAADLVFVLLTPDDRISTANESNDEKRRARQNVIFELGYFLGFFGRSSGKVFLLHKGPIELPSDISGIVYIDISQGVVSASETIRKELHYVS